MMGDRIAEHFRGNRMGSIWRRVSVFICLCLLPLLAACSEVRKGNVNMPVYQTAKITPWSLELASYRLDSEHTKLIPYYGQNWFEFSDGTKAYFTGMGSGWLYSSGAMGGGNDLAPSRLHLYYFDQQSQRSYLLDTALPQEQIYKLFQERFFNRFTKPDQFDKLVLGIAPQGHIFLWVSGFDRRVEVAHFVAQVQEPSQEIILETADRDWGMSLAGVTLESDRQIFWNMLRREFSLDSSTLEPATVKKLRSGWQPSPDWYLDARITYPWRVAVSSNTRLAPEYRVQYVSAEERMVFAPEAKVLQNQAQQLPEKLYLYVYDKNNQQHLVSIQFYTKPRNVGENDTSELRNIFKKLYPNRQADNRRQPLDPNEFTTLQMEFTDDLQELSIFVVKGNQRIELKNISYDLDDSVPFQYRNESPQSAVTGGWGQVPYNAAQPLQVKIGEVCPQTGYWSCEYLSSKDGLFMRAGDRMPGQSAVARGDVSADTLWTLVKPEG